MGNLSIGRSLIIRQLLYISVLVTVSVAAYFGSLQLRDLAHEALTASPATMHLYAVQIDQAATKLNRDLIFVSALGSLLVLLVSMPIAYFTIARPVDKLARQMSVLAGGDVDIEIDGTERKDEIGAISRALRVLRDGVKKNNELVAELHARDDREKRLVREAAVRAKVEKFSAELSANVARLTEMTKRMSTASQDMISGARDAAQGSSQAKTASSNAAGDVSSVAVASEQLLASIEEISRQVVQSTTVVKRAVSESIETSSGMARLTEAARRVGDIVSLISRIAAQTNLLALNATIEAARAGEAGRGFAVVAQEVKTLATQTARATQDISGQIADMQAATESSVTAIDTIQIKIGEIEQISAIIASAVQEQGASTQEIARNVRSAASGTTATSAYVEDVAQAAALTSHNAESLVNLADELDTLAAHVLSDVRAFGEELREAALTRISSHGFSFDLVGEARELGGMKISLIQMNSRQDKAANIAAAVGLIERAVADERPDWVGLPECFDFLGGQRADKQQAAEVLGEGPAYLAMQALARRHGIFIHAGSILEKIPGEERLHNTTLVFDRTGREIARYRKIHMFDVVTPDGTQYRESASFKPGTEVVTYQAEGFAFGCTICYDLRFPDLFQALAEKGADVIVLPSAFTLLTGKDHWEVLCRARAVETETYFVAPGQTGTHVVGNETRATYGHSLVVDPWGHVIARASDGVGIVSTRIERARIDKVRAQIPVAQHKIKLR